MINLMYLEETSEEFEEITVSDVSIIEKHEILSHPQVGHGIFTLLAITALPNVVPLNEQDNTKTHFHYM